MDTPGQDWIDELIGAQRPGHSLDQAFYQRPEIFARDLERVLPNHWMMAAHESLIPGKGDYLLFDVGVESIILIRGADGQVHAHFNVCRHRGSRVLLEPCGTARSMTCRYHGWTYAADGSLKAAPHMPDDFDPGEHGLKPCHVRVIEGLIFICLADGEPPDLEAVVSGIKPFLQLQGIAEARVAHRQNFPVAANWKLAIENYLECYHCKPAHPQYTRIEIKAEKMGDGSPAALKRYEACNEKWRERAERLGTLLPDFSSELPLDDRLPRAQFGAAYRAPLREAYQTASEDGLPVAPLMGGFPDYDGGETALGLGPFTYMLASNDHAVFFQFVPREAERSDMIITWLVNEAASEDEVDKERLTWLWTVTTLQDKAIIEANAAGVRSSRYQPGPASLLESDLTGFRNWYLAVLGPEERLAKLKPGGRGRYFGL